MLISAKLSEPQIDALVNARAGATGCGKAHLNKAEVIAQITAYEEAEGAQKPSFISAQISITGYDLTAYQQVSQEGLNNLKSIVEFLNGLELTGVGENVTAGIGDAKAELKIQSPSAVFRDEFGRMSIKGGWARVRC